MADFRQPLADKKQQIEGAAVSVPLPAPAADLKQQIEEAAQAPLTVSADGLTVTEHSLSEKIEADRYLAEKVAAKKKHHGLRFTKLVPPGSV